MFVKAISNTAFYIENLVCTIYRLLYIYMHKNSQYQMYNDEF